MLNNLIFNNLLVFIHLKIQEKGGNIVMSPTLVVLYLTATYLFPFILPVHFGLLRIIKI